MNLRIRFQEEIAEEVILHHLRNIKKTNPYFKHYISEVITAEGEIPSYEIKNEEGKTIIQCLFEIREDSVMFFKFKKAKDKKTNEELEKMLCFYLPESIGRSSLVSTSRGTAIYYDGTNFYLSEKQKSYKLSEDFERLIEVEKHHTPMEMRKVGN